MKKGFLVIVLLVLFIISNNPISFGNNTKVNEKEKRVEKYNFDIYDLPEYVAKEGFPVLYYQKDNFNTKKEEEEHSNNNYQTTLNKTITENQIQPSDGLMDSAWPMYCHDIRHTGRSPYSTIDTWDEIWRFKQDVNDYVRGSPVVSDDGIIYFGGADFYALYPNGTMKWKYDNIGGYIWSCPAIDEFGVIYIGSVYDFSNGNYLYAIYPDGTLKWKYFLGDNIFSSPAIGEDGTIFIGHGANPSTGYINALFPNGTLKWSFQTGHAVYSSPAIGSDGIVYCGSHDTYLYALYPNNGTLKWKYKTGNWIRVSPCIGDDGTIYVVSLDNYLHAVNCNGSLKWKTYMGNAGTSPTIGWDGTIYCGYNKLFAINPTNGSVKWTFDVDGAIKGSTPCNSIDGTIYFGSGCWFYAMNPDGTLKWRRLIANEFIDSAPAISENGTIYIGTADSENHGGNIYNVGYLHAFGIGPLEADANGPYYEFVNQPVQFKGSSSGGYFPHSYQWNFGDTHTSNEQNPTHTYTNAGNYTVTLTVTDNTSNTSTDITWAWIQNTNTPPNKPTITGPTKGKPETSYSYTFVTTDIDGTDISYYTDWGDNENTGWKGSYSSGKKITLSHTWDYQGIFTIKCKAKDPYNSESDWGTLEITMPRNRMINNSLFLRFFERFLILQKIFNFLTI